MCQTCRGPLGAKTVTYTPCTFDILGAKIVTRLLSITTWRHHRGAMSWLPNLAPLHCAWQWQPTSVCYEVLKEWIVTILSGHPIDDTFCLNVIHIHWQCELKAASWHPWAELKWMYISLKIKTTISSVSCTSPGLPFELYSHVGRLHISYILIKVYCNWSHVHTSLLSHPHFKLLMDYCTGKLERVWQQGLDTSLK